MSASTPSVCKTISWILAILLIGMITLLNWYIKNEKSVLSAKDAEIAQSAERVTKIKRDLDQSEKTLSTARADNQALKHNLEESEQANERLQSKSEELEAQHARALAAEQKRAHQAYVELEVAYKAANERAVALGNEIKQLKQATADAAKAHKALMQQALAAQEVKTQQLEQELKKKVDYYRTALEGSNPERAAQLAGQEQKIRDSQLAIKEAMRAMHALQEKSAGLEEQLADANRIIPEREQALSEADKALKAAQTQLAQEQSARSTLQQKSEVTVAKLRRELETSNQRLASVEARLSTATEAAALARKSHQRELTEAQSEIADLQRSLKQNRLQAAKDIAASRREGNEALSRQREIFSDLSQLGGRQTDQGILLSLAEGDIRFRVSQADIPQGELPILDEIAQVLAKHHKLRIRIEGHTDNTGRDETNLELSQSRADAVKKALVERGVDPERLASEGMGESRPIADNATLVGRRENRRVEIYVTEN